MAFALLSRSRSKTQGSVRPVPKQKSARAQHSADSQFGFAKSLFQPLTTALPTVPVLQTKLKIGEPDDKFEQEADRVAEQVMRMPNSEVAQVSGTGEAVQRKCAACASGKGLCPKCAAEEEQLHRKPLAATITPLVQRQPVEEEEKKLLRTKASAGQAPQMISQLSAQISALRGSGRPLPPSARAFFEPRFRADFSDVQVHTDGRAAQLARAVNARAFTVGRDMVWVRLF
jgi:hypothetical protein